MDCNLEPNSLDWLNCNNSSITNSKYCQSLPENIFDIEVLDDQSNQIQQFEGSEQGTTIQNLEPGTYTVNEIKNSGNENQLGVDAASEGDCINAGFTDGGRVINTTAITDYFFLCFEYEDEQGNECSI